MGIFRRGRKGDDALEPQEQTDAALETGDEAAAGGDIPGDVARDVADADDIPTGAAGPDEADAGDVEVDDLADLEVDETFSRARGPFDVSEVDADDARLDLGSIQLVPVGGMQLRLELDESQETVVGAHALIGDSGVQLQAFAAPRTTGLWAEIREEIAQSIVAQGGTADIVQGPLGRELIARMPSRGADGRTVFQPVRFLGVDGPRWFLRGVISGTAAVEESAAEPLVEIMRSVVVVRGEEAMPPREVLPMQLPTEIQTGEGDAPSAAPVDAGGADGDSGGDVEATPTRRADDLKPFERGPEITEVR